MTSFIRTFTGREFWPLRPDPDDVDIEDIAHALSMKCRYNGHTDCFYSVAEHSVRVSWFVGHENRAAALLHDAAEAYLPDVASPIKPYLTGFADIETRVTRSIFDHFGISLPWAGEIDQVDKGIRVDEMRAMLSFTEAPSRASVFPTTFPPNDWGWGWSPKKAKAAFLEHFKGAENDLR